jgi:hypothetical protein
LKGSNLLDLLKDLTILGMVTMAEEVVDTVEVEAVEEASEEIVPYGKGLR